MSPNMPAPCAERKTLVEPPTPHPAPIYGARVRVERAFTNGCQSCGGHDAKIEEGKGQNFALIRCVCGQFRGWLSKYTGIWLAKEIATNGPADVVDLHNGRVAS
jgi:hypothetical protein